jgi:uncharacterized protein YcsI (UPF0317 family)
MDYKNMKPKKVREYIRSGALSSSTQGMCSGYAQANLVILPKKEAFDFLLFCQRNPKPCPLLDVTEVGNPIPLVAGKTADIRFDVPGYRVYKKGELIAEVSDLKKYWKSDSVAFLLGCSFSFEGPLLDDGLEIRHITDKHNVPMYKTNIECSPAGIFHGPMVVSMRPMKASDAIRAIQITSRMPFVHGAPIHIGDPKEIGIKDLSKPDFGDPSKIKEGEIPVFWACGVTPQAIAMEAKPDLMITHVPGHMFITDILNSKLAVL